MAHLSLQPLVAGIFGDEPVRVTVAQGATSEIYVGCSNGELLRFSLQADASYALVSRQTVAAGKPIDDIVILSSHHRAFIQSDGQLHFYTVPSLDPILRPIRHVVTFAVDHLHLQRPASDPIDFCVVKRKAIAQYTLRDKLYYSKEIPLPQGGTLAKRIGHSLCIADSVHYNIINLEEASLFPILPLSQALDPAPFPIKPSITVIGDSEFLILSWTGASTIGVFITGEGDPVRGTLEWPSHPESVCLDYPYVTTLLPNQTIEVHNIESQSIAQVIASDDDTERMALVSSVDRYLVPCTRRSEKMKLTRVPLVRNH